MLGTDVAYDVWYTLGDTHKTTLSEPHMLVLLNEAISLVTEALNLGGGRYLAKETAITMDSGEGTLPRDYDKFINVWSGTSVDENHKLEEMSEDFPVDQYTFRIMGDKIYSSNDSVYLRYKRFLDSLTKLGTKISLPETTRRNLKNIILELMAPSAEGERRIQAEIMLIKRKCNRRERKGRVSRLPFVLKE